MHAHTLPEFAPIDLRCVAAHHRRSASTSDADITDGSSSGNEGAGMSDASAPLRVYTHNPYQRVVFGTPQAQHHGEDVEIVAYAAACPAPPPPYVMCCYFKQKGSCRMGENCWHGHHGDAHTPCHYGAKCKAGHAHLSSGCEGADAAAPASQASRSRRPAQESLALAAEQQPCRLCGQYSLVVQSIPLHEGAKVRRALRALCGSCKGAFLL